MVHNFDLPLACFARQRLVAMRVGGMVDVADFLQQSLCVSPGDGETVNVRNPPFNRDKKNQTLGCWVCYGLQDVWRFHMKENRE